jgi:hypothetical protein
MDFLDKNQNSSKNSSFLTKCILELLILSTGLILNSIFILIIYKKKKTKRFLSPKPFRYLLISILISHIWYLINELNIWFFFLTNHPSLTVINGICQLNSYFNALFSILLEFHMIFGSFILFQVTFRNFESDGANDIYNKFLKEDEYLQPIEIKTSETSITIKNFNEISCVNTQLEDEIRNSPKEFFKKEIKESHGINSNKNRSEFLKISNILKKKVASIFSSLNIDYRHTISSKKFEQEEVYFNIMYKEKFLITLNVIVWVYLNSFLIWIYGIQRIKSNYDYHGTTRKISSNFKLNKTGEVPNPFEEISVINGLKFCAVYTFAKKFFKTYCFFIAFLRLITLFFNLFASSLHCIVFQRKKISVLSNYSENCSVKKTDLFNAIKHSEELLPTNSFNKNFKRLELKSIQSHFEHLHFMRNYSNIIFFYSLLIAPSIFREFVIHFEETFENFTQFKGVDDNKNFKSFYLSSANSSFDSNAFDTLKIIRNDTIRFDITSNALLRVLKDFNDDQHMNDTNVKVLIRFSEILAHSMNFFFYIIFSLRFKIFFRIRNKIEKVRV